MSKIRNKKVMMILGLFAGIVVLGVGYAISNVPLMVAETATSKSASLVVYFSGVQVPTATATAAASSTVDATAKATSATFTTSLTNLADSTTVTYTIKNGSETGIKAKFDKTDSKVIICQSGEYNSTSKECNSGKAASDSDWFTVTTDWDSLANDIELASGENGDGQTTTIAITTKLKKVNATNTDHTETFEVHLVEFEPVQE